MKLLWAPFGLKPNKEEGGVRYGDVYARGVASGIDLMILIFVLFSTTMMISDWIFGLFHEVPIRFRTPPSNFAGLVELIRETFYPWIISNVLIAVLIGVLFVGCQLVFGTTPGKWVTGLKIVKVETLAPPERWRFVLRFFAYIPAMLPLMLGIIWISFNKQRRGWHDYIAGTVVIHTRPKDWAWLQAKRGWRWVRGRRAKVE